MFEVETPLDSLLVPPRNRPDTAAERAERFARGDFSDPSDSKLDASSFRRSIIQRLIGRAG